MVEMEGESGRDGKRDSDRERFLSLSLSLSLPPSPPVPLAWQHTSLYEVTLKVHLHHRLFVGIAALPARRTGSTTLPLFCVAKTLQANQLSSSHSVGEAMPAISYHF